MKPKFRVAQTVWNTRLKDVVVITEVRKIYDAFTYDHTKLGSGSPELEPEENLAKMNKEYHKMFEDLNKLKNRFTYHPPIADQLLKYVNIREKGLEIALLFKDLCPPSTERDIAIIKLEEAVMWANAAIARNE